jgi:hypothetical protein
MGGDSFVFLLVVFCIYFLPTLVAATRDRTNSGAIFVLNLFLGWTLIGWVVAFIWSVAADEKANAVPRRKADSQRPAPPQPQSTSSPAGELEKLASMRERGLLTDAEFDAAKRRVLNA